MSKPSEALRPTQLVRSVRTAAAVGLLAATAAASAGVNTTGRVVRDDAEAPPVRALPAPKDAKQPVYQLRCWQYGRLLFEEHIAALPADARVRLAASDRSGRPVQVLETHNSTCLLRVAPPDERAAGDDRGR